MTQRIWKTTDNWEVLTGWDRPLQYYFLTISRPGADGKNEYLFDNLDDKTGLTDAHGGMSQAQIYGALERNLTDWPKQIMPILSYDRGANLGNNYIDLGVMGQAKPDVRPYQREQ